MSQNGIDFAASNPSGVNLLDTLLTGFQEDVRTNHSGTSRPSYVVAGMLWLDTTTNPWIVNIFNGTDDIVIGTANTSTLLFTPSATPNIVGDLTPQLGGFLDPNSKYIGRAKGADIASASPLVLGTDGDMSDVTGTTGFSVITVAANRNFVLQFDGVLTITHGSGITLPGGADFTTAAGDVLTCQSTAANTVLVTNIAKADGTSVVSSGRGITTIETQAASSSAYIDIDMSRDFPIIEVELIDVVPASESTLFFRASTDGGSTVLTATNSYEYHNTVNTANTGAQNSVISDNDGSTYIRVLESVGSGTSQGISGTIRIFNPLGTALFKAMSGEISGTNSSNNCFGSDVKASVRTASAVDVLRIYFGGGDIESGTFITKGIGEETV